jgi:hypothetical protein
MMPTRGFACASAQKALINLRCMLAAAQHKPQNYVRRIGKSVLANNRVMVVRWPLFRSDKTECPTPLAA